MNLETKITIYKFTPQLFTLTHKNTQSYILGCKKGCKSRKCLIYTLYCGETGIRTPDTLLGYTRFPGVPLQPLEHLSFFRSAKIEQIFRTSKYLSPQSLYSFQEIQL